MKYAVFLGFFLLYLSIFLPPSYASEIPDGRALYIYWCRQCHGVEGRGDGVNSTPDMLVNPRDHTDAAFMSSRTDAQLEEVIRYGGISASKSAIMPPWGATLTDQEIKALLVYLRKLCNCKFEGAVSDEKLKRISPGFK